MADLPVVNAIEAQSEKDVENRETLQRSFRASLGALGTKIRAQTNVLTGIADTMDAAYNLDQQEILRDVEERLEEKRKKEEEQAQKDKEASLVGKVKGGLIQTLKKAFLGAALIGAILFIKDNWDKIKETFEKIKPTLVYIKDRVMAVAEKVLPFLLDNFDIIFKSLFFTWIGLKVWKGIQLMMSAVNALKLGWAAVQTSALVEGGRLNRLGLFIARSRIGQAIAAGWTAIRAATATAGARLATIGGGIAAAGWAKLTAGVVALKGAILAGLAALAPALVAAAPFIAVAAAVAVVLYSLKKAWDEARAVFEDTESITLSITESIAKFFATIFGLTFDIIKDITSWAARSLGFDKAADYLDSFSVIDLFQRGFALVIDKSKILLMKIINSIINGINKLVSFLPERIRPKLIGQAFDIDEEERLIAEKNRLRNERMQEKLDKENEEAKKKREAKDVIDPDLAGTGPTGAEIDFQSMLAEFESQNFNITTFAPNNINAPTSTSISNLTAVTPSATRTRTIQPGNMWRQSRSIYGS